MRVAPLEAGLAVYGMLLQGRHDLTCCGERARAKRSAVAAPEKREP